MARGLRAGDPKLKIVTGNLTTGKSHDYAKSVTCIAGLEDLYDVLNVHSYAQLENWPTWHRSFPEDARLKDYLPDIRHVCEWRDAHAPGKEVWLTEFGYDSSTKAGADGRLQGFGSASPMNSRRSGSSARGSSSRRCRSNGPTSTSSTTTTRRNCTARRG
jgi:serine/threonine-protein kinase ATR